MKLLSKNEAKLAWANDQEVEYKTLEQWGELRGGIPLSIFSRDDVQFRLKPRTITINGIEVPAPFEPKAGEQYFTLDTSCTDDYDSQKYSYPYNYDVGIVWQTEEEIKQVVEALRGVFKPL